VSLTTTIACHNQATQAGATKRCRNAAACGTGKINSWHINSHKMENKKDSLKCGKGKCNQYGNALGKPLKCSTRSTNPRKTWKCSQTWSAFLPGIGVHHQRITSQWIKQRRCIKLVVAKVVDELNASAKC